MNLYELIRRKRDGGRLAADEIGALVSGFVSGKVQDYQMAAWLMAVWYRGMTADETSALALAMMNSGEVFDLSGLPGPRIDKHSTGGVGDKVSLILAPLVAACGVVVPMVSGRGLGHTGGTLDKLESIPGFRTDLKYKEFRRCLETVGVAMMGQTERLCPADRRMYALRDVTATVDSLPLIAASIMCKKLAEGIDGLVLDVKTGSGAFMARPVQARRLARQMIDLGAELGKRTTALLTSMAEPLGCAVGNAVEVVESIEALKGNWPSDLAEVTLALGVEMLLLAGQAETPAHGRRLLLRALAEGKALGKFRQMVEAQGGDPRVVDDYRLLPTADNVLDVRAEKTGYVTGIDPLRIGLLGVELGVGRASMADGVDHAAGFSFRRKVGDKVARGDVLVQVFASDRSRLAAVGPVVARAISIGPCAPRRTDMVLARIGGAHNGRFHREGRSAQSADRSADAAARRSRPGLARGQ
jgi:pyrimidine-nucleoside phosphorylase